jgi:dihydroorotate dehydrogenase electron transfer subunit
VELDIIHRVVGIGTDWLSHLTPGDTVNILGPLGNRFELPPPDRTAILVGGGVGIPPMLYLAEYLKDRNAVAF